VPKFAILKFINYKAELSIKKVSNSFSVMKVEDSKQADFPQSHIEPLSLPSAFFLLYDLALLISLLTMLFVIEPSILKFVIYGIGMGGTAEGLPARPQRKGTHLGDEWSEDGRGGAGTGPIPCSLMLSRL